LSVLEDVMGRSNWQYRSQERERESRKTLNPIWRGVGCILVVVLAVLGYILANWFYTQNLVEKWIYLPPELIWPSFAPFLGDGVLFKLIFAGLSMILGYAIVSFVYAIAFPIEPGELDVPPPKRPRQRRRR
jgi:hypothetical protein